MIKSKNDNRYSATEFILASIIIFLAYFLVKISYNSSKHNAFIEIALQQIKFDLNYINNHYEQKNKKNITIEEIDKLKKENSVYNAYKDLTFINYNNSLIKNNKDGYVNYDTQKLEFKDNKLYYSIEVSDSICTDLNVFYLTYEAQCIRFGNRNLFEAKVKHYYK